MPLEVLLILVVGGIAGVAILLQALGYSRAEPFTEDSARAAWLRQEPDIDPCALRLSRDGMAALVETRQGPGLVWHMGADSTACRLDGARAIRTKTGLRIVTADFAAPSVRVALDAGEADIWTAKIEGGAARFPAAKPQETNAA